MKDPRHDDAMKRAKAVCDEHGVFLTKRFLFEVVQAVLQDDTEHDATRYGRHLREAGRHA